MEGRGYYRFILIVKKINFPATGRHKLGEFALDIFDYVFGKDD